VELEPLIDHGGDAVKAVKADVLAYEREAA
jgi:hypothetical protein